MHIMHEKCQQCNGLLKRCKDLIKGYLEAIETKKTIWLFWSLNGQVLQKASQLACLNMDCTAGTFYTIAR